MSKKMKRVALETSINGSFEGAKARFKHQSLIQDYQQLEKEADAAKNKLEIMKQRKLSLLAEVRFLRQRRKYFLEMKEEHPQEMHTVLQKRLKNTTKEKILGRKEVKLQSKPPMWNLNMREMSSSSKKLALKAKETCINRIEKKNIGKEVSPRNKNLGFNLNQKERIIGAKVVTFKHPSEIFHSKQKEMFYMGKETNFQKNKLGLDLNQMDRLYAARGEGMQNRAPVFDLNLKLGEEDLQESYETLTSEEPKINFGVGNEEQQLNDLKLSICRDLESVPSDSGKRKISWQDPVAMKASLSQIAYTSLV